ncbi:hypothetical protein [Tuwongella immobilis]|uniref:Uncharacterized protein n=1 Tax=Tuwongella immobilis TaxID=692036 RepID=A0A6C2YXH4_9BACT|nr:hypothetical protein [Tuwongella immobilis]VIP05485.1 unnamed protein product [Tuwongella immobilis]VTS08326.1 unnamed protein product [Tuwongella immobilis]
MSTEIADYHASARQRVRNHRNRTYRWAWIFLMMSGFGLMTCLSPFALLFIVPPDSPKSTTTTAETNELERDSKDTAVPWLIGLGLITFLPSTAISAVLFLRLFLYRRVENLIDTAEALGMQFVFTHEHPSVVDRLRSLPEWPRSSQAGVLGVGGMMIREQGNQRTILAEPGREGGSTVLFRTFTPVNYVRVGPSRVCLLQLEIPSSGTGIADFSTGQIIDQRWAAIRLTDTTACGEFLERSAQETANDPTVAQPS